MMSIKQMIALYLAKKKVKQINKWSASGKESQEKVLSQNLKTAKFTEFGKDHDFTVIQSYEDYKKHVPIRDYEGLKPYIDKAVEGQPNILWKGKPLYFAKTSGTTSGAKYIPLTKESMPYHIRAAKEALLCYINNTKDASFVDGKMIFLQGSPEMKQQNGIGLGRLSGIVAHYVPSYLQKNRLPSWETNCIEDWEEKLEKIIEETKNQPMILISGIPPWMQMYFERLIDLEGKKIKEIFPDLKLLVTGGVSYQPYRAKMTEMLGGSVDTVQTYPASEGFIAFQDKLEDESLLLLLDHGIFYEFVPLEEIHHEKPTRLMVHQVELNKDYVIIMSTNAGLWAYNIGDTVRFVSKNPYKIRVSGRVKHFISAFGEHVIGHEVESAMKIAVEKNPCEVSEFSVAPKVNPKQGNPYHDWLIEFEKEPQDLQQFALDLDHALRGLNIYYEDLISGGILRPLVISMVEKNGFEKYMKSKGKLGGQNKVPRLSNDRKLADEIEQLELIKQTIF